MAYRQSELELLNHLKEQLQFISDSCDAYDKGRLIEAKRISSSLRIILNDKGRSISLLSQLKIKDKIKFCDSAGIISQNERVAQCNLILASFELFSGQSVIQPTCFFAANTKRRISFEEWWNQDIYFDMDTNRKLTRADIILTMADQDGGAHVDVKIRNDYASIAKQQLLGWGGTINGIKININNAIYAMIRQLAYEVLTSLKNYSR